ncbi:MAG: transglutaminase domain-containing protein [Bacteroidales bacterium]|nr:transglutaminase domain-containing protein [Bacteroidales bacterium]
MRKILALVSTIAVFSVVFESCTKEKDVRYYTDFLLKNMSSADSIIYTEQFWEENVAKTLQVRENMGWNVSERDFKYFVLPLRVNNENLDDFRTEWADSLCRRVKGMSMEQAILEINHWCHEMATYAPSDARTSSPLATIRKGLGRCGEESVLAVSALRAVGIPARQVYTPRWAHTDDNHAWVEAISDDGKWHFIGACEPEPKLDMAWFNAPVSRAMLLHTKVFGKDYDGPEEVIQRTPAYTEINVTANYVPVVKRVVEVVDEAGNPVEGAEVSFKIYNYAEFYTVATYLTDSKGYASLTTGNGDMLIEASRGDKFGLSKASGDPLVKIELNKEIGQRYSFDFDIVPPVEDPIPSSATKKEIAENKKRFELENQMREARPKGNQAVIEAFWKFADSLGGIQRYSDILESLSVKDMNDVSLAVLTDAYHHSEAPFSKFMHCPRVELEFLYPYFDEIGQGIGIKSPADAAKWTDENIRTDTVGNPQHLRIPPVFVWRSRVADPLSKDIFFVALCRAKGFEARIDEATGKAQYREGEEWLDLHTGVKAPQGMLLGTCENIPDPLYYKHFSISKVDGSKAVQLALDENIDIPFSKMFAPTYPLDCGYYMLTSGNRMADGSVLAHIDFFPIEENKTTTIELVIRKDDQKISVIGSMDPEKKFLKDGEEVSILSQTGRGYFLVACLGYKDEPTTHAVRQLTSISELINDKGLKVVALGQAQPNGISGLVKGEDKDDSVRKMLSDGCKKDGRTLPVIALCDSFGRIVYYSQGYNTSLAEEIKKVLLQI